MISEIDILFFKASLTIRHTATVSQKKSGTSKKIQWDFQISRVGSLDFLDLKVNGSPVFRGSGPVLLSKPYVFVIFQWGGGGGGGGAPDPLFPLCIRPWCSSIVKNIFDRRLFSVGGYTQI